MVQIKSDLNTIKTKLNYKKKAKGGTVLFGNPFRRLRNPAHARREVDLAVVSCLLFPLEAMAEVKASLACGGMFSFCISCMNNSGPHPLSQHQFKGPLQLPLVKMRLKLKHS